MSFVYSEHLSVSTHPSGCYSSANKIRFQNYKAFPPCRLSPAHAPFFFSISFDYLSDLSPLLHFHPAFPLISLHIFDLFGFLPFFMRSLFFPGTLTLSVRHSQSQVISLKCHFSHVLSVMLLRMNGSFKKKKTF